MIKHFFTRQFILFLFVGGFAATINWTARFVLSQWLSFSYAVIMAYLIGMSVAFFLNTVFVFPGSPKPRRIQARDFVLVNFTFLPLVWGSSIVIEKILSNWEVAYSQAIAHGIAVALPAALSFLIYKFFTFKQSPDILSGQKTK